MLQSWIQKCREEQIWWKHVRGWCWKRQKCKTSATHSWWKVSAHPAEQPQQQPQPRLPPALNKNPIHAGATCQQWPLLNSLLCLQLPHVLKPQASDVIARPSTSCVCVCVLERGRELESEWKREIEIKHVSGLVVSKWEKVAGRESGWALQVWRPTDWRSLWLYLSRLHLYVLMNRLN